MRPPVCDGPIAKDYASVFQGMEPVSPPPKSGILSFAPKGSRLFQTVASQIQPPKGVFGYVFTFKHPQKALRLNWLIKTRVVHVDRGGRAVEIVGERRQNAGLIHGIRKLDFTMDLPARLGVYRYELEFRKRGGSKLAKYSQYLRVVRPRMNAVLQLAFKSYQPGEVALIQVTNTGTEPVVYGEELLVKAYNGTYWERASGFSQPPARRRARRLNAGESGRCEKLHMPSSAPPGLYRVEKQVSTLFGARTRLLTAYFHIEH